MAQRPWGSPNPEAWTAQVRQIGRWTYQVDLVCGAFRNGDYWFVLGRNRAQKKAEKELAKKRAELGYARWDVT